MTEYNFTITLYPFGTEPGRGIVKIDPAARYGYFEHRDGSEGGGLWFEQEDGEPLALVDYDGVFSIPHQILAALRAQGITAGPEYD